jgi:hypothetical protein
VASPLVSLTPRAPSGSLSTLTHFGGPPPPVRAGVQPSGKAPGGFHTDTSLTVSAAMTTPNDRPVMTMVTMVMISRFIATSLLSRPQ